MRVHQIFHYRQDFLTLPSSGDIKANLSSASAPYCDWLIYTFLNMDLFSWLSNWSHLCDHGMHW